MKVLESSFKSILYNPVFFDLELIAIIMSVKFVLCMHLIK